MKTFLYVDCGSKSKDRTTKGFNHPQWNGTEVGHRSFCETGYCGQYNWNAWCPGGFRGCRILFPGGAHCPTGYFVWMNRRWKSWLESISPLFEWVKTSLVESPLRMNLLFVHQNFPGPRQHDEGSAQKGDTKRGQTQKGDRPRFLLIFHLIIGYPVCFGVGPHELIEMLR